MRSWADSPGVAKVTKDFCERTLAHIPAEFGKLVYLSTLRDLASGRYSHAGLEALYPDRVLQQSLLRVHREVCMRITELPLEQQAADLSLCLRAFEGEVGETIRLWRALSLYVAMLPEGLPPYVQKLFCSNVEALLAILAEDAARVTQAA